MAILPTLLLPVLLGLSVYFVLIGAIDRKLIDDELLTRYVTGHSVSKVTTAMFLVGMAALLLVASEVWDQFQSFSRISLHERRRGKRRKQKSKRLADGSSDERASDEPPTDLPTPGSELTVDVIALEVDERVKVLQSRLFEMPARLQKYYLWKRLNAALAYIRQHKTANGLDDELKYLSDVDADRKHERYSLVRILIWATPMLGFLGTVLGISEALGGISVGPDNDFQTMMSGLQSSLYIAFDTTALALTFSIVLMFCQFLSDRFESQLLLGADEQSKHQLNQFFTIDLERENEHLHAIRSMGEELLKSTEKLVEKQCSLWNHSIVSAQAAWVDSMENVRSSAEERVSSVLNESAKQLASEVAGSISKADKTLDRRIKQWQTSLSELSRKIADQHQQLANQTEAVVEAATQFESVEQLQNNLLDFVKALPDSNELNDTSDKMATAIRLLEYRMERTLDAQEKLLERTVEAQQQTDGIDQSSSELAKPAREAHEKVFDEKSLTEHLAEQQSSRERSITIESLSIVIPDDTTDQARAA